MDKVLLTVEDVEFLLDWRDKHIDLIRKNVCPLQSVKIICEETECVIKAMRTEDVLKIWVNKQRENLGRVEWQLVGNGFCKLLKDRSCMNDAEKQDILTVYASTMTFMAFCNDTEQSKISDNTIPKKHKKHEKSEQAHKKAEKTYIFTKTGAGTALVCKGKHNSPKGIFTVRGHFRHYKSGKVVWVESFEKGTGKKNNKKKYVLGV